MFTKRLILALVISIILIVFTACSFENSFKDEPNLTSITGILKEQKSTDNHKGTHVLIDSQNKETLIRSVSLNLSADGNLNNKVQLTGFLNTKDNVFEVTGISILEKLDNTPTPQISDLEEPKENLPGDTELSDMQLPLVDIEFVTFESLPYHFSSKYPKSWYYAGVSGKGNGILHHYGFSKDPLTDDNELISMDVTSSPIQKTGEALKIGNNKIYKTIDGDNINLQLVVNNQNFKIQGNKEFEQTMLIMASEIIPIPFN
ncbi:hypothetical protein HZC20_00520 [Candidatus Peregrinibacteria bacterium]|nr:hypothetical protein [Candidatus Peregrinibacteria bacterium]